MSSILRLTQSTWGVQCSSGTRQKHVLCGPLSKVGEEPKMPKRVVIHRGEEWKQVYLSFADTWHHPFLFKWLFPLCGTHWMGPLFKSVSVNLVFVRMLTSYIFCAVVLSVSLSLSLPPCLIFNFLFCGKLWWEAFGNYDMLTSSPLQGTSVQLPTKCREPSTQVGKVSLPFLD